MIKTATTVALVSLATSCFAADQSQLIFDAKQLGGWWAESYNTDVTCSAQNLKSTMSVSADGKRLEMQFDRKWKTELGETDHFGASVVASTERTLIIRYDGETRLKRSGKPVEWELAIVAPGMYRWRETEWKSGEVNTVVGIRCSP